MLKYLLFAILLGTLGIVSGIGDEQTRIFFGSGKEDLIELLTSLGQAPDQISNQISNQTTSPWFEPSRQPSKQYSSTPESENPQQHTNKYGFQIMHKIKCDDSTKLDEMLQNVGSMLENGYYDDKFRYQENKSPMSIRLCCDDNVELTNCVEMKDYETDEDCSRKVVYRQSDIYAPTPDLVKHSWSESTIGRGGTPRGSVFSEPRQNGKESQQPRNLGNPTEKQNTRWNVTPPLSPPPNNPYYKNNNNQNHGPYSKNQRLPSFQNSDRWTGPRGYQREPEPMPEPIPRSKSKEWFKPNRLNLFNKTNTAPQPEQEKPVARSSGVSNPSFNPQRQPSVYDTAAFKPQQRPNESNLWSKKPAAKTEPDWSYWGTALPSETASDSRPKNSPRPPETAYDNRPRSSPQPSETAVFDTPVYKPPQQRPFESNPWSKKPAAKTESYSPRGVFSWGSAQPSDSAYDNLSRSRPKKPTEKASSKKYPNLVPGNFNLFKRLFGGGDGDDDDDDDGDDDDDVPTVGGLEDPGSQENLGYQRGHKSSTMDGNRNKYSKDKPHVYKPVDITTLRRESLERHNYYRNKHRLQEFSEDEMLNQSAQEYANQLAASDPEFKMDHSELARTTVGENLMFLSCRMHNMAYLAIDAWWAEIRFCSVKDTAQDILDLTGPTIGHVTQLLWSASIRLGCGIGRSKKGNYYFVCHYDPSGNYKHIIDVQLNVPYPFSKKHIAEAKVLNQHFKDVFKNRKNRPKSKRKLNSYEDASDPENANIENLIRRLKPKY